MKKFKYILIFLLPILFCNDLISQINKKKYLNISAGSLSFGTGDFMGYSILIDGAVDLIQKPKFGINKLLIGPEIIFENGVKNPTINSNIIDYNTFNQVSSSIIWGKVGYYPFTKSFEGLNINIGPTLGYSYRSKEGRISFTRNSLGEITRSSILIFNNTFNFGYRISIGYDFNIEKKIIVGARLDFSNNNIGEINTLAGCKFGVKF